MGLGRKCKYFDLYLVIFGAKINYMEEFEINGQAKLVNFEFINLNRWKGYDVENLFPILKIQAGESGTLRLFFNHRCSITQQGKKSLRIEIDYDIDTTLSSENNIPIDHLVELVLKLINETENVIESKLGFRVTITPKRFQLREQVIAMVTSRN